MTLERKRKKQQGDSSPESHFKGRLQGWKHKSCNNTGPALHHDYHDGLLTAAMLGIRNGWIDHIASPITGGWHRMASNSYYSGRLRDNPRLPFNFHSIFFWSKFLIFIASGWAALGDQTQEDLFRMLCLWNYFQRNKSNDLIILQRHHVWLLTGGTLERWWMVSGEVAATL